MRILYATDGSRGAQAAADLLVSLPLDSDCQVMVLTVVPHYEEDHARAILAAARDTLRHAACDIATLTRRGDPAEAILRVAEEHPIDLVVVGTRGLSALERFFLGSVAERVVRHSPCPVLLVRPGHGDLRRVIVGVDGSQSALQSTAWLQHFPLPADCAVQLVTVLPHLEDLVRTRMLLPLPFVSQKEAHTLAARQCDEIQAQLNAMAAAFVGSGKRPITDIRRGDPALVLLHAADDEGAGLIVVGSHGLGGIERFVLGSVSEKVLRHAHCSVLVVKQAVRQPLRAPAGACCLERMAGQEA
jgi:nucleotide-binding universal stress UspA family protein